jgi:hypothetical protein
VPVTGHGMAVRNQVLLQSHNIRSDLSPDRFGRWRAYISGASASLFFLGAGLHKVVERTVPLRSRMTRQVA